MDALVYQTVSRAVEGCARNAASETDRFCHLQCHCVRSDAPRLTVPRPEADTGSMVWFFTSAASYIRCETRYGPHGAFELVITQADGSETVEHYERQEDFASRWTRLEIEMSLGGWSGPRPRDF